MWGVPRPTFFVVRTRVILVASLFNKIVIIGAGLIGSSIAQAVRQRSLSKVVWMVDRSERVRAMVSRLGFADRVLAEADFACTDADFVILCTPIGEFGRLAAQLAPLMGQRAILSDVGSVKSSVVRDIEQSIPNHINFVPAHPIAGAANSGPEYSSATMFEGRWCVITPCSNSSAAAVRTVTAFWEALGSQVEIMSAASHDLTLAVTSHIPHAVAYVAVDSFSKLHLDVREIVERRFLPSVASITRTAQSDPSMWRDIFIGNRDSILEALGLLSANLTKFEKCLRDIERRPHVQRRDPGEPRSDNLGGRCDNNSDETRHERCR